MDKKRDEKEVIIYDTTLRDGAQGEGISFTVQDKRKIAELLDLFGVSYIEGGWPGANPKDSAFFQEMKNVVLKHAKLVAFGSTCKVGLSVENDPNLAALLAAGTKVVTIFGKTWDFHVSNALNIHLEKNLTLISESIAYLRRMGIKEVIFDAEHFFDGFKNNQEYALKAILAAQSAGADCIVLCDTNGGLLPFEIPAILEKVREVIYVPLGIHCHNDSETAVANSLIGIKYGIRHVQGTINGIGERCGNANLCSIIPAISLKMDLRCISEENLKNLCKIARFVSEIANLNLPGNQPYVGDSAFAHKGGVHVSAIRKDPRTYEHHDPNLLGNKRRVLMSEQAGKSNLLYNAVGLGLSLENSNLETLQILEQLKELENSGFQFEAAEGSLRVLIANAREQHRNFFDLVGFRVIVEKREGDRIPLTEATIRVKVDGKEKYTAAMGDGPLNALDTAFREALVEFFPVLEKVRLRDYKVRILPNGDNSGINPRGTGAKTRVLIQTSDGEEVWGTVGVSENIIEASWQALVDSILYKLLKEDEAGRL